MGIEWDEVVVTWNGAGGQPYRVVRPVSAGQRWSVIAGVGLGVGLVCALVLFFGLYLWFLLVPLWFVGSVIAVVLVLTLGRGSRWGPSVGWGLGASIPLTVGWLVGLLAVLGR